MIWNERGSSEFVVVSFDFVCISLFSTAIAWSIGMTVDILWEYGKLKTTSVSAPTDTTVNVRVAQQELVRSLKIPALQTVHIN